MRYLVGNWKSYNTISQTHLWLTEFAKRKVPLERNLTTIICAPFTNLAEANRLIGELNLPLELGAQDVSSHPEGKHTGEVTARMLSELVRYCLVGHSERRREFNETSGDIAEKTKMLLENFITPIVCLDTPYLDEQIRELLHLQLPLGRCIFAYEPVTAIGTGKPIDPVDAEIVAGKIAFLTESQCHILYGGSVTHENVLNFVEQKHISGVLVGTDSLTIDSFTKILSALL